jgi:nitrogen fixation/metabolism regulation signal transduction histidine kinase
MVSSDVPPPDEGQSLLELVVANAPTGLLLIDGQRIILTNPTATTLLHLDADSVGHPLTVDGPDGLLADRFAEAARSGVEAFSYTVPAKDSANEDIPERIIKVQVVPVGATRLLAHLEDITGMRRADSQRDLAIRHTFHELKTPLGVLSLGLSNVLTYYDRLPEADRIAHLEDLSEQVREMNDVMTELFSQLRNTSG